MSQNWVPPDIASICPEQLAPLTQCSSIGFMYLTLLTQLFGKSLDSVSYPFPNVRNVQNAPSFGTSPAIETSIFGPTKLPLGPTELPLRNGPYTPLPYESAVPSGQSSQFNALQSHQSSQSQIPLGLTPFKPLQVEPSNVGLESVFQSDYSINHETKTVSHGPKGSRGFSATSFYLKTDPFKSKYENFPQNSFENSQPHFDFNYLKRFDAEAADSKVNVVEEKKQKKSRRRRQAIEQYDFIVVGAGSAGCVIANRLSEVKKWKVLLIEAGPEEPEVTSVPALAPVLGNSNIDWQYRTQPEEMSCRAQRGQTCSWLSGRVMGGSSSINYLVYMRGNKKDYDTWAQMGNKGWSYNEVLPYFRKSENNGDLITNNLTYHGIGGPLNVERFGFADKNVNILLQAFQEKGLPILDANGKYQLGAMTTQTTSKNGERASTNVAFIRPIRKTRKNLTIITNAMVTKVLIEPEKKIAYGVKYFTQFDGWHEVHAIKEVILSAGALGTPKILMLSGIGPEDELKSLNISVIQNLSVGKNLQDHATTNAMLMKLSNKTSTQIKTHKVLTSIEQFYKNRTKYNTLSATGPLQITAFIRTKYADADKTVPDIQFHFDGRNSKEFYSDPTTYLATNTMPFAYYDSINVRPILLSPKSRGYVTLNRTDPIFGPPLIYSRFFTEKEDINTLIAALKYIVKFEKTNAFKENGIEFIKRPVRGCEEYKWGTRAYFACLFINYTGTIYHPAGTCKMGPVKDAEAVVDSRLRVHGIRHLRVADASIMPTIVRGNTNAAVIMIGEKVSDMIKDDWEHYL